MKIGTLCYATEQGLGILAKSFYDAGVITDALVVLHGRRETHMSWFPRAQQLGDLRSSYARKLAEAFCSGMDLMLFFETPFIWELIPFCRANRIRTALMPMYECMPAKWPHTPDIILNPSHLDQQYFPAGVHVPVPVDGVEWRQRHTAKIFVHNAGHGGLKGRNGTKELLEAMQYVVSPIELIVRSQDSIHGCASLTDQRIKFELGTIPYEELWSKGDVFVFPEKFNGLSLPLQEARAAGMLVMCADRQPMNQWLPREPLIPVAGYRRQRVGPPYTEFEEAIVEPRAIAAKIDEYYGKDITQYSQDGKTYAEDMAWEMLKPKYLQALGF